MIEELFKILKSNKIMLSAAESITGGHFSSLITKKEGASEIYSGSFVCYSNLYKYNILNVSKDIDVFSIGMARELSEKTLLKIKSDISISFTGNSSSANEPYHKKGKVYIGISNNVLTNDFIFESTLNDRDEIIDEISREGIKLLIKFIKKNY